MGVTHYVTITTLEYALWNRMEGAAAGLLRANYGNDGPARAVLSEAMKALRESRNGFPLREGQK